MKRKPAADALADRPSPKNVTAYRAWLKSSTFDDKIETLRTRLRETQDRILEAEENGGKRGRPNESETRVDRRAKSLIGEAKVPTVAGEATLDDLFEERAAIGRALAILSERKTAQFIAKISDEMMLRRDEGRDLAYRRAKWALEGRKLHEETEAFKASLAGAATPNTLFPTGEVAMAQLFSGGGTAKRIIDGALAAGVITRKEIE